jgi:hypothetical protein
MFVRLLRVYRKSAFFFHHLYLFELSNLWEFTFVCSSFMWICLKSQIYGNIGYDNIGSVNISIARFSFVNTGQLSYAVRMVLLLGFFQVRHGA